MRSVRFIFPVRVHVCLSSRLEYLLDWALGCEEQWARNLAVSRWMITGMG